MMSDSKETHNQENMFYVNNKYKYDIKEMHKKRKNTMGKVYYLSDSVTHIPSTC